MGRVWGTYFSEMKKKLKKQKNNDKQTKDKGN